MGAHASISAYHDGSPPARSERSPGQLRLVLEAAASGHAPGQGVEVGGGAGVCSPRVAEAIREGFEAPVLDLASYVLGLGEGHACFCCGGVLRVVERGEEPPQMCELECRECGATITRP